MLKDPQLFQTNWNTCLGQIQGQDWIPAGYNDSKMKCLFFLCVNC